ncbi:hypothetical protein K458DRAFT_396843 [Lentithecium fluviatile CBS 122367]|uniref:Uncharacterized protein n=1 Tax=Lentithecium fluviatile CBS 122367 TaxID=1168545 RepID=A0A6G1IE71_9PLEO|nr:hypothetical protein K458DRAFT_396843 [Lentithecium fluviatile CBS 122367]
MPPKLNEQKRKGNHDGDHTSNAISLNKKFRGSSLYTKNTTKQALQETVDRVADEKLYEIVNRAEKINHHKLAEPDPQFKVLHVRHNQEMADIYAYYRKELVFRWKEWAALTDEHYDEKAKTIPILAEPLSRKAPCPLVATPREPRVIKLGLCRREWINKAADTANPDCASDKCKLNHVADLVDHPIVGVVVKKHFEGKDKEAEQPATEGTQEATSEAAVEDKGVKQISECGEETLPNILLFTAMATSFIQKVPTNMQIAIQ